MPTLSTPKPRLARLWDCCGRFSLLRFFDFADCSFHCCGPYAPRLFFDIGVGAHRQSAGPALVRWQWLRAGLLFLDITHD